MKLSENCLKKYSVSYGQFRNNTTSSRMFISIFSVTLKNVITFKNVRKFSNWDPKMFTCK